MEISHTYRSRDEESHVTCDVTNGLAEVFIVSGRCQFASLDSRKPVFTRRYSILFGVEFAGTLFRIEMNIIVIEAGARY